MFSRMNLNLLRVFHIAAKLGSFTRAAQELHLTQPGISKHIKELERCSGTRLFDRLGRRVILTQAGEILFQATGGIFHLIRESKGRIDDLQGLAGGKLSIGASITIGTYILPELLVEFREKYPGVDIKMDIALSQEVVGKVLDNALEIGFVGHFEHDKRLIATLFRNDQMVLIVSTNHEWAGRKQPVRFPELTDQQFLFSRKGSGTRMVVEEVFKTEEGTPKKTMELGTTEGVMQAVAANLGISILSEHVVLKEVAFGAIKKIPLAGVEMKRGLYLVRRKDKYLSESAQAFLSLLE